MESDSDSTEDDTFYSCSENYVSDSDQEVVASLDSALPSFLGSVSTELGYADSETIRALVCINAARILLAEAMSADSLRPFMGNAILKRILAICAEWKRPTEESFAFGAVVLLPLFQSSLEQRRFEYKQCTWQHICGFIAQLQASPSVAVIGSYNDTLTVLRIPFHFKPNRSSHESYIIFNPQCRASPEMAGASLRCFPSMEETIQHVYNITSIHRGVEVESSNPEYMYAGYLFVPPVEPPSATREIGAQYLVNMRLLKERSTLEALRPREASLREEISTLYRSIDAEQMEEESMRTREHGKIAEAVVLKAELGDVSLVAAALLERQPSPAQLPAKPTGANKIDPKKVGQASVGNVQEVTPIAQSSQKILANDTSADVSHRSKSFTSPTSPGALLFVPVAPIHRETDRQMKGDDEEASIREARRLESQSAEEAASLAFAQKLVAQDLRDKIMAATKRLAVLAVECPLCLDRCQEAVMVQVDRCRHTACRRCIRDYVGGQVGVDAAAAGKPVPCPMCPVDQQDGGVVIHTLEELADW